MAARRHSPVPSVYIADLNTQYIIIMLKTLFLKDKDLCNSQDKFLRSWVNKKYRLNWGCLVGFNQGGGLRQHLGGPESQKLQFYCIYYPPTPSRDGLAWIALFILCIWFGCFETVWTLKKENVRHNIRTIIHRLIKNLCQFMCEEPQPPPPKKINKLKKKIKTNSNSSNLFSQNFVLYNWL